MEIRDQASLRESSFGTKPAADPNAYIFLFEDCAEFLNFVFRERQRTATQPSLRAWATELGYRNPSLLSEVLNRKRKLGEDLAERVARSLHLSAKARDYLRVLRLKEIGAWSAESLAAFKPKGKAQPPPTVLSLERYTMISEWYHFALIEMTRLADFKPELAYLRSRLGNGLSTATIQAAVQRLLRLGLLRQERDGSVRRAVEQNYVIDPNISSEALRHRQRQWLELAKQALHKQSLAERDFFSSTISFRMENFSRVRAILRQAHEEILALQTPQEGEEIYQLCTQFFRLTRPRTKAGAKHQA